MTRHDRAWRLAGFGLLGAGYAVPIGADLLFAVSMLGKTIIVLIGVPLAITGTLLVIQGDRIVRLLRVECSRHRELLLAVRARRRKPERSSGNADAR